MASNEFIENPVLFFLHDKVDVMKNADILSIAISFYGEEEIRSAKQTLYRIMGCGAEFVDRRGGDASKNNVSDMLRKLTTSAPLPVKFCVTNSRRLPPVSLDHIDVAALLKSVMEIKTELIKCQGNLQRQESLFHDKLNEQQAEIEALKSSSALQLSYAGVTRQASSAPPQAARQLRSAPSGTSPPPSSGAQSGTGGGTGRQQNARQSTMTRRTNTATSVGTSMLPARRQQAETMVTSGTNNDVSNHPQ